MRPLLLQAGSTVQKRRRAGASLLAGALALSLAGCSSPHQVTESPRVGAPAQRLSRPELGVEMQPLCSKFDQETMATKGKWTWATSRVIFARAVRRFAADAAKLDPERALERKFDRYLKLQWDVAELFEGDVGVRRHYVRLARLGSKTNDLAKSLGLSTTCIEQAPALQLFVSRANMFCLRSRGDSKALRSFSGTTYETIADSLERTRDAAQRLASSLMRLATGLRDGRVKKLLNGYHEMVALSNELLTTHLSSDTTRYFEAGEEFNRASAKAWRAAHALELHDCNRS